MVITGASRGIGAATARQAGRKGYAVAVNYRNDADGAAGVVRHINENGGRALAVQADVASEADVVRMFDTVETELGPVRALVNNAGIPGRAAPVADLDSDEIASIVGTNFTGTLLCAREAVRRMGEKGGVIINISSTAAIGGGGHRFVTYAATKGAIETLTVGLSRELGGHGIRVNAVRPGGIDTPGVAFANDEAARTRFASSVPLGRIGEPDEVANAVIWLASDEAGYVTGAVLTVSGGR